MPPRSGRPTVPALLVLGALFRLSECATQPRSPIQYSFARTRTPEEAALIPLWRRVNVAAQRLLGSPVQNEKSMATLRVRKNLQAAEDLMGFPCNTSGARSPTVPRSVHTLRPGDIDVVAAMGDSLTASNGAVAVSILDVINENRGLSWSGGGQGTWKQFLTVPNIVKEFNPQLFGYSLSDSRAFQKPSQFNVGEINSMSQDLPWQAANLVKRLRTDPRVDMKGQWKLVTMLVGSNDFCSDMCYRKDPESFPEQHRQDLTEALRILKEHIPRTFVNLVLQPNLKLLSDMKKPTPFCQMIRRVACSCLHGEQFKAKRAYFFDLMNRYIRVEWEVAADPEFQTDDFAVVAQPFATRITWPMKSPDASDFSFMAPDCFHFSQRGYARAANALWNNMLEPVGSKTPDWSATFSRFLCPTPERPYLFTARNSAMNGTAPGLRR